MLAVLLWLTLSERARRIGLFGDVFRGGAFIGAARRRENFGFTLRSVPVSALTARDRAEGE